MILKPEYIKKLLIIGACFIITALLILSFVPLFSPELACFAGYSANNSDEPLQLCYDIATGFPLETTAKSVMLIDMESLHVLTSLNPNEKLGMASTTKIMTALVALDLLPLSKKITIPKEAVGIEGSSIYLLEGETLTTEELLYGLLLESGNDVATTLAIAACGDVVSFVDRMNRKAAALGLKNTHFSNPHGLSDDNHYTTAEDLATLTAVAMRNDIFRKIVSEKKKTIPYDGVENGRILVNHNKLLSSFEGAVGVKTGYTKATGRCLVTAVRRNGQTLIAVTLDCSNDWAIHKQLHDWGFENYQGKTLVGIMDHSYRVNVVGGENDSVICQNTAEAYVCVPADSEITSIISLPQFIYAPVYEGDPIGKVTYYTDSRIIYELPLVATDNIRLKKINFWRKLFNG
ncbi:MAG: hypothetical protein A2Y17_04080 [Clostridiales bacterium GWF2_38_85]|nr:MAG: hypothetical protein A2Y17_04080 [Clostridiales bacterium GWF2_38_85]HBL83468.1 D-alanyl-D-alanine carboxypeptidase [Clostridiales bacterium]